MGGWAIQFAIVYDAIIGGGGRGGDGGGGGDGRASGRRTVKATNSKRRGWTRHQTWGCCLKAIQLGQVTLSMWKCRTSKGSAFCKLGVVFATP